MSCCGGEHVPLSEHVLAPRFKVAVLASGNGSNLQAIIDKLHLKPIDGSLEAAPIDDLMMARIPFIEICLVISDQPGARAIQRAWEAGIPTAVISFEQYETREAHDAHMMAALQELGVDLVVLAGYMRLLAPAFVEAFQGKLINVHPAILPAFPGTHSIADALEYGAKVTGVTVHFVELEMDSGPVIAQETVRVEEGDTTDTLANRVHKVEHELFPWAIRMIAAGKVQPPPQGSRWVRIG
ncbi:MAG: phosphoribosylglycinamide formyltransferase [Actinobacteria bacterium]|nr:phosphoribosylglycinamide formyltransferase [Actinomycetota bacterium]